MQEEAAVAADLLAHLPGRLEERQRLDVADGAADLGDDDVDVVGRQRPDAGDDLVGDVRDDLDGVAEVLAAALLGDDRAVDLPGRDVGAAVQVLVEEALVVADVEVGLGPVVGDEDLAVLERVHRPGVDVEVRVELLHRDPQPARLEQAAETRRGESLAQRGRDATGDEQVARGVGGSDHVAAPVLGWRYQRWPGPVGPLHGSSAYRCRGCAVRRRASGSRCHHRSAARLPTAARARRHDAVGPGSAPVAPSPAPY